MAYLKNKSYCDIPFCIDTPHHDFYIYSDLKEIADKCNIFSDEILKCRTVGILQSLNGRFYLSDLNDTDEHCELLVQVSVVYLKSPPHSTVIPYPVQVFGTLQWKKRPVIFAKILQADCLTETFPEVKPVREGCGDMMRELSDLSTSDNYHPSCITQLPQVLSVSNAIRVKNALSGITSLHLARNVLEHKLLEDPP